MISHTYRSYVYATLKYLEKDWAWAPMLLSLFDADRLSESDIEPIASYLADAISQCKDQTEKLILETMHEKLIKIQSEESREKMESIDATNSLLTTIL
jgi:hypothetical protein